MNDIHKHNLSFSSASFIISINEIWCVKVLFMTNAFFVHYNTGIPVEVYNDSCIMSPRAY